MILLFASIAWADPIEDQIQSLLDNGNLLTARRLADVEVAQNPRSIIAHYALGEAYAEEDGNLGRARPELEEADRLYDARYPNPSEKGIPWTLHADIVYELYDVCKLQEDYTAELKVMDHNDANFDPDIRVGRGWALMKLGREDEARALADEALKSDDFSQVSTAHNVLCVLESEDGHRKEAAAACLAALDHEHTAANPDPTVDAANAGAAALQIGDFSGAERMMRESTTGGNGSATNPWGQLVDLYVIEGRGADTLKAVEEMQRWRAHMPADMRDQSRAEVDRWLATFLFVAGHPEKALPITTRAVDFPDRRGMNSEGGDQAMGSTLALRIAVRDALVERTAEEASTRGVWGRWKAWFTSFLPNFTDWSDRRRLAAYLTDDRRLRRTIRPYMDGGIYTPRWRMGEVFDVIGDGVAKQVIRDERPDEDVAAIDPYYDAMDAELAWRAGDYRGTVDAASKALSTLSTSEVLLRARLSAMAGYAATHNGDADGGLAYYEDALVADPGVFRRLHLAIPAAIEGPGSGVPGDAVAMLWRSPRIKWDGRGFQIRVEGDDQTVTICLYGTSGARLTCVDSDRPAPAEGETAIDDDGFARLAVMAFADQAFGLPIGSSGVDLDSLDGTTTVAGQEERAKVDKILEGM